MARTARWFVLVRHLELFRAILLPKAGSIVSHCTNNCREEAKAHCKREFLSRGYLCNQVELHTCAAICLVLLSFVPKFWT